MLPIAAAALWHGLLRTLLTCNHAGAACCTGRALRLTTPCVVSSEFAWGDKLVALQPACSDAATPAAAATFVIVIRLVA
jgi:hypothetical protein